MLVRNRGKEGKVEEIVKKARVVFVKRWGMKVICVLFESERRNGKVYYLGCTRTKLSGKKVRKRYMRRVEIEVTIRIMKQEMGIGKRQVRNGNSLKAWVGICMVGYLMCMGREGM